MEKNIPLKMALIVILCTLPHAILSMENDSKKESQYAQLLAFLPTAETLLQKNKITKESVNKSSNFMLYADSSASFRVDGQLVSFTHSKKGVLTCQISNLPKAKDTH